jgi:hypothetical protein
MEFISLETHPNIKYGLATCFDYYMCILESKWEESPILRLKLQKLTIPSKSEIPPNKLRNSLEDGCTVLYVKWDFC